MTEWSCADCGEVISRLTWLAIDAVERPDLLAQISDLVSAKCPRCRRPLRRSQPLLVLRLAKSAPVIAARASDDETNPFESLDEITTAVRRELGDSIRAVPGPAVIVTFDEIEAGVQADIDADLERYQAGNRGLVSCESDYRRLLNKIVAIQMHQRIEIGLEELALVGSEAHLREVVARFPEIVTDEAEQCVVGRLKDASTEDGRRFANSMLQTLQMSRRGDFQGAWSVRESVIQNFLEDMVFPRLSELQEARIGASRHALAKAGRDLLEVLPAGTFPGLQIEVASDTVAALLEDTGEDRDQNVESAIALGQFAISILDEHRDLDHPQRRFRIEMNLSTAFGMRSRGDPVWNFTQGITTLKEALDRFPQDSDRDYWAMAQTNLALLMINRGASGDHKEAREHLELALTHRSIKRNPRDWAYTQLNLAVAYSRAKSGDRGANLRRAIGHSVRARDAARLADDTRLLAQAEHNLAAEQHQLSQMEGLIPRKCAKLLNRAKASATESARLSLEIESPVQYGRAWLILGKIRLAQGDESGAIGAFKTALTVLSAGTEPAEVRDASRRLAQLAEAKGDIGLAADAAAQLVEAAAATISARSRAEDRLAEHSGRKSTDFRFAAHALVRARRLREALLALEHGRARELGLLTMIERVDLDALSHLDPGLSAGIEAVGTSLRADILGVDGWSVSDPAEQLALIRSAVKQTPNLELDLDPPTLDEISKIALPRCPLVYFGSAPRGSFAVIVDRDRNGQVELEAIHAPDCESSVSVQLALIGISPATHEPEGIGSAYLHAQMYEPGNLDASLAALSPLIGDQLLRPLADLLADRAAVGVTLVPTGLLGLMPLHAITWNDTAGNRRCLIDDFDVTFAQSARVQATCRQRASRRVGIHVRFVGIANPLPHPSPLPGAEFEIELIQKLVQTGNCLMLKREEATKRRVVEALPTGTHIHFACHAGASFFDPRFSAAVSLSDEEELSALEVARLELTARLVVASACETGVLQGYDDVDESLGLSSAFIAAGAAGVVSTLWAVDDYATALIISKFYEGVFGANKPPANALRDAQLWLRDADMDAIDAYASDRVPLRALRDSKSAPMPPIGSAPYGAPSFWAAFTFTGA